MIFTDWNFFRCRSSAMINKGRAKLICKLPRVKWFKWIFLLRWPPNRQIWAGEQSDPVLQQMIARFPRPPTSQKMVAVKYFVDTFHYVVRRWYCIFLIPVYLASVCIQPMLHLRPPNPQENKSYHEQEFNWMSRLIVINYRSRWKFCSLDCSLIS